MSNDILPFMLFAGDFYYPCGGMDDFQGSFSSIEVAKDHLISLSGSCDWAHIIDVRTITKAKVWEKK